MKILPIQKVDNVMGVFTRTIAKLNTVQAQNEARVTATDEKIATLQAQSTAAATEANRARVMADKLSAMVDV